MLLCELEVQRFSLSNPEGHRNDGGASEELAFKVCRAGCG